MTRSGSTPRAGTPPTERLCVALDTPDLARARSLVETLSGRVGWFKVGLTLFSACGRDAVEVVRASGASVFLDLKFHDIPTQVAGAVAAAARIGARLVTVHAAGGPRMLEAAASARRDRMRVVAVTVPTSLGPADVARIWPGETPQSVVSRLAGLAVEAGLDGAVVSYADLARIRTEVPEDFFLVTPGLRGPEDPVADQARTGTPIQAYRAGADLLVLGRSVTAAPDPLGALERLLSSESG